VYEEPAGLQVLFVGLPDVPVDALRAALREYHPSLADVSVEPGEVVWGDHRVRYLLYPEPMPSDAVSACLNPALLPADVKADAQRHRGHAVLYYAGSHPEPLEQLVAVGTVAGAMARFDAIVTLNEEARTAVLAIALTPDEPTEDMLAVMRALPLPFLWGGFAKFELSDRPGLWIRTFANPRLGVPNLARWVPSHEFGEVTFQLFGAIAAYLRSTGLAFETGELIRIDDDQAYTLRDPQPEEWWLDSRGPLVVLEAATLPTT
jgi:hypothetical protein